MNYLCYLINKMEDKADPERQPNLYYLPRLKSED